MKKIILLMGLILLITTIGCADDIKEHDEDEHEHSVEIEGSEMKYLTVQEVADLWEIDSEVLLSRMIMEFGLKGSYSVNAILEDIRDEYKFSPAMVKDIAEDIKQKGLQNG